MEGISDTEVRRGRGLYFFGIIMSTIAVILIQIFTLIQSTCTEGCQILSQHTDIFIILSLTELGLDFITMIIITRIPY